MSVPVENVYYLFAYAWDLWADGAPRAVGAEPGRAPPDLFARVLVAAVGRLLKRRPDRSYVAAAEDSRSPRGKVAVADTVKRALARRPAVRCDADDLRHDVPHNRIL